MADEDTAAFVPAGAEPDGNRHGEDALLHCAGVNAAYGQLQVLFGVDLTVREGEIVALLGTNGAGKSSLLRSVTGLLPASAGTITFEGRDVTSTATESIASMGLTMMPGGRGVFPSLTVSENLRVASWPLRRDRAAAEEARARAIALFPILGERAGQQAGNLSGGEQQMLSLAMAFLVRPRLLCIDELSLGLAPTVVSSLLEAVRDIHRAGTTILIVEQSVNVALLLAERATFLEKGQVRFTGPAAGLLDRPDLLRAVFIGSHDGKAELPGVGTVTPRRSGRKHVGPTIEQDGAPALECTGLVKRFGGIRAVDEVDLTVMPHEVVGLIGHNGAGKTTFFDVISGFLTPDGGRIRIFGEDVTDYAPYRRARTGLGRSFQDARLFPSLTVAETISVALERHLASRDPFAAAFRMPACTDSEAAVAERVEEVIEQLGLAAFRQRPIGELSTGTRRIVELACVLAQRPSLLLLDEPSGGVAQAETEALGPLLRKVATDTECTMIVIEHDMAMISALCDRLVALELGAVIAEGTPAEVLSHPEVIASYLGTDAETVARSGRRRSRRSRAVEEGSPAGQALA
ncbi:MAG: ATP-binding cassette domain-containing protein [Acidimicrobiia bacterium]|nr:ATP-binding cassette domain-containing protein [Acidimicrobiia bacterium]